MQQNPTPSGFSSDDPATVDLSGRCVGQSYILIRPIGHGATGTVWRALQRMTGEQVAVKLLHESLLRQPKLVTRFVQERTILMMLRHENIVGVRDLFSVGESLGLVMDLVTDGSLRDHLRSCGTLPPGEAARLLAQVTAALTEAHGLGVVHRDVKPDNILLHRRGSQLDTRLTDFGIARVLDKPGLTTPHAVIGTPQYMAPESITGAPPTPAADMYAVGVVLYELIVGRTPYAAEPMVALLSQHLESAPERHAAIPDAAWSVIDSCMAKDPERRPSAAELTGVLRDLTHQLAGLPAIPVEDSEADGVGGDADGVGDDADPAAARRSAPERAPHPSLPRIRRAVPVRRNRPRSWLWGRPGAMAALVAGALLASGIGGFGASHLRDMRAVGPLTASAPPAASALPAPGGTSHPGQSPSAAAGPAANTADGRSDDRSPAGGTGTEDRVVTDGQVTVPSRPILAGASAGPVKAGVSAAPGGAHAGTRVFGPWRCADAHTWDVGHPVVAKPCHSVGSAIRVVGTMQASPGVQVDISLTVQDAETNAIVAGPHTCRALMFTDAVLEHRCGPVDLDAPHGRRYVVMQSWRYTAREMLPGGTVSGPEFSW
ncbi:MAG TPA: serine/threonine-protein kinase [Catenuloplanes sp.]